MKKEIDTARQYRFIEDYLDNLKALEGDSSTIKELTTRFYNNIKGLSKVERVTEFQRLLHDVLSVIQKEKDILRLVDTRLFISNNSILKYIEDRYNLFYRDSKNIKLLEKQNSTLSNENDSSDLVTNKLPPFYYQPQYTYQFLRDYNQDEILSTTCHLVDSSDLKDIIENLPNKVYDYNEHHKLICERFDNLCSKWKQKGTYKVNTNLRARFKKYLTGKNLNGVDDDNGWATNIKANWGMREICDWSNKNNGIPPNPDGDISNNSFDQFEKFEPTLRLVKYEGIPVKRIQNFCDLTYHFKYLFHIREDNNLRDIIINNLNDDQKNKIEFNLDEINLSIDFFTDVDKLYQVFQSIIRLILSVKDEHNLEKPKVVLKFYRENKNICFSIHHVNTVFKKDIQDIERMGKNIHQTIKLLNGIGEFEIKAKFPDNNNYLIKYWDYKVKTEQKPYYNKIEEVEGVEGVEYVIIMKK